MLTEINEVYRGLKYVWGHNQHPENGEPFEVAEGVWWVRFAMPISLDHINIWLLEDGDGWTVVDTSLATKDSMAQWEKLFTGFMANKPVKRVICTHMHPDHMGLAGWLCERFNCPLWMTREEFLQCHLLTAYTGDSVPEIAVNFYHSAGYTTAQLDGYKQKFGAFGKLVSQMPHAFRRIVDRETLTIGGRYWQVIVGSGHSPEHACLYCPALKIIIGGDQILPRITPNVSVFPTEPEGNPLLEWMESCARLISILPDDLITLPAHQSPFRGLHIRLNQMIDLHRLSLQALYEKLDKPHRVIDCFTYLFKRPIDDADLGMATGETLANLNLLLYRGNIRRTTDPEGINWYQQNPDARFMEADHDQKSPTTT